VLRRRQTFLLAQEAHDKEFEFGILPVEDSSHGI